MGRRVGEGDPRNGLARFMRIADNQMGIPGADIFEALLKVQHHRLINCHPEGETKRRLSVLRRHKKLDHGTSIGTAHLYGSDGEGGLGLGGDKEIRRGGLNEEVCRRISRVAKNNIASSVIK